MAGLPLERPFERQLYLRAERRIVAACCLPLCVAPSYVQLEPSITNTALSVAADTQSPLYIISQPSGNGTARTLRLGARARSPARKGKQPLNASSLKRPLRVGRSSPALRIGPTRAITPLFDVKCEESGPQNYSNYAKKAAVPRHSKSVSAQLPSDHLGTLYITAD